MDKAAVGFDYKSQAEKHDSQKGELGEPKAAGSVRTGASDCAYWGCGALCLVFATCCMNGGKAMGNCRVPTACSKGMGQMRKAIAPCMTAGKSSG